MKHKNPLRKQQWRREKWKECEGGGKTYSQSPVPFLRKKNGSKTQSTKVFRIVNP
jgi:hypothetical protein